MDANTVADNKLIAENREKLEAIIFPSVEFVDTRFEDVLFFLKRRSVELDFAESDPARKGVDLIIDQDDPQFDDGIDPSSEGGGFGIQKEPKFRITISQRTSYAKVLRHICEQAGFEYTVEPNGVKISRKPVEKVISDGESC